MTSGRTWRRFFLGIGVLLVVITVMALARSTDPSPPQVNPIITFLAGAILGYLIGWWVTADRLV